MINFLLDLAGRLYWERWLAWVVLAVLFVPAAVLLIISLPFFTVIHAGYWAWDELHGYCYPQKPPFKARYVNFIDGFRLHPKGQQIFDIETFGDDEKGE